MGFGRDIFDKVKKRGVKVWVKIPLTRKIPMDYERQPGDYVDTAMRTALLESLCRRSLRLLDILAATDAANTPNEERDQLLSDLRFHLSK